MTAKPMTPEEIATIGAEEPCYPPRLRLNTIDGEPIVVGGTYFDANGHRFVVSAIYLDQTPHGDVVIGVRSEEGRCCWWNLYAAAPTQKGGGE